MTAATWVFDVDGCLIDSLTGSFLRPGASELLAGLRARGDRVLVWSAGGADYARRRAVEHGIDALIDAFHGKDTRDEAGRYATDHVAPAGVRAHFVDDRPEDLPPTVHVLAVSPYLAADPHDRGLAGVAALAELAPVSHDRLK